MLYAGRQIEAGDDFHGEVRQRVHQHFQRQVARAFGDDPVKAQVEGAVIAAPLERELLLVDHVIEALEIVGMRAACRQPRNRRLDQQACFGDFLMRGLAEPQHQRQRAHHRPVIQIGDERAAFRPAPDRQQAELFEGSVRFAHRHAAGAITLRHVALCRELFTGQQRAVGNLLLDASGNRLGHASGAAGPRQLHGADFINT